MSPEQPRKFDHLSQPNETLRSLTPADIDIVAMRQQLVEAGFNLEINEAERQSLSRPKFRNFESGRGIGMVAVLGPEKAEALLGWCQQRSEGGPKLKTGKKVKKGSEGRGLRQLAADIIQLVTTPEPTRDDIERFCLRTNQRVKKGLLWDYRGQAGARETINQAMASIPDPELTFSSVPSGSVADLWDFLVSK